MADQEHVVCVIDRGEHGAIRVARKTFNGSQPFTDLRFFYKDEAGNLKPTAKGTSIRDSELHSVLDALAKIANKIESGGRTEPRVTRSDNRQRTLPNSTTHNAPVSEEAARAQSEADSRLF